MMPIPTCGMSTTLVMDGVRNTRRKFSSLTKQALLLQAELRGEIDRLTTEHQNALTDCEGSADIMRNQLRTHSNRLQQYRDANWLLRLRNQELARDLEAKQKELEKVDHLRCNICMDRFKSVMTI